MAFQGDDGFLPLLPRSDQGGTVHDAAAGVPLDAHVRDGRDAEVAGEDGVCAKLLPADGQVREPKMISMNRDL